MLRSDLTEIADDLASIDNLDDLVSGYNSRLRDVLDKLAPIKSKHVTLRHQIPWFDKEASRLKTETRNAERRWMKHKSPENWHSYRTVCNLYRQHLELSKHSFIRDKITACGSDSKLLFRTVSKLTGSNKSNPLPEGVSDDQLADDFAQFFFNKIDTIRQDLEQVPVFTPSHIDVPAFASFSEVDVDTVCKLIGSSKPTTCDSDPIPSFLVKLHSDIFAPIIGRIINISFSSGVFPHDWKRAIVKPLLKKPDLDHIKKNYRPISNLQFVSKISEKASLLSFNQHINTHNLLPSYQSAYRAHHSTETLLVKIYNDILHNMELQYLSPLVAIDLSAAFDTVNHDLLIHILHNCFGVCDLAQTWIASYLSDRSFDVCINQTHSSPVELSFSVPQGSINGPVYFTCYASTLKQCVADDLVLVGYADDHNIYGRFKAGDSDSEGACIIKLSTTMTDINQWMSANRLKMNNDKSEFVVFGSNRLLPKCETNEIQVGEAVVQRSHVVKLLGVHLDENLNLKQHIARKTRAATLAMLSLKKLKPYLNRTMCLKLANATIFSHIDYCNSLFIHLPKNTLRPLNRVISLTAKIILGRSKFDSTTQALKDLHILPVHVRSEYKVLVLVYKCLHNLAPSYLSDLLKIKTYRYPTRESTTHNLFVPRTKHKIFADRAFSVAGPRLWNDIPDTVRDSPNLINFKCNLKTHLFIRTFGPVVNSN